MYRNTLNVSRGCLRVPLNVSVTDTFCWVIDWHYLHTIFKHLFCLLVLFYFVFFLRRLKPLCRRQRHDFLVHYVTKIIFAFHHFGFKICFLVEVFTLQLYLLQRVLFYLLRIFNIVFNFSSHIILYSLISIVFSSISFFISLGRHNVIERVRGILHPFLTLK